MGDIMLTKKQNIKDNKEWLEAFDKCTKIYTRYDIDKLTDETIYFISSSSWSNYINNR